MRPSWSLPWNALGFPRKTKLAFSPENQDWVHTQIQTALDNALKDLRPPSGFKKALYLMREWGVLAGNFTFIGALVFFAVTQWNAANKRLADESMFQKGTEDRLKAIEVVLKDLQHPSPLGAFVKMNQTQFSHELVRIADVASRAQRDGVTDSVENIDATQKKLAALPLNTPEASRAVSSVVTYASFVREKTGLFPNGQAVRSKPCASVVEIEGPKDRIRSSFSGGGAEGCKLELDGLSLKNFTVRNTVVTYNGGAVHLENVTFVNCLFIISLPSQLAVPARQLAEQILAKNVGPSPTFTLSVG